ncbi:outer membrane beta-barrel protein [Pseudochryseolinea flava]|uniref:Outer membrane protein beta-barrel domain-containing protein n=1 Tax=Pseudochryseolinea flava TaxID=2059302 RepID=A0A364Y3Y9_9BACT|nr:outer membrane beta-barrel protein [Pseudochryseolinea flava]RAW00729.1 hypothetical protein DQQ10_14210 [Pseudochryseolinea flava]
MKKIFIIALLAMGVSAKAQRSYIYVGLDVSKPSAPDFVTSTSSSGVKLGYRYAINEKFSVGLDFNRNTYDHYEPTATYETTSGHMTTDYFAYIYSFGIAASGQYHFKLNNDRFSPYAGLGLGAVHNEYALYYNIYTEGDEQWGFLARPEVGITARMGRSVGAFLSFTYDYTTNKSEYFELDGFRTAGFQLGLLLMNRR